MSRMDELFRDAPDEFSMQGFHLSLLGVSDLKELLDYIQMDSHVVNTATKWVSQMVEVLPPKPVEGSVTVLWKCITVNLTTPVFEHISHCSVFEIEPDPDNGETVLIRLTVPEVFIPDT